MLLCLMVVALSLPCYNKLTYTPNRKYNRLSNTQPKL
jgi:hypothetical protein